MKKKSKKAAPRRRAKQPYPTMRAIRTAQIEVLTNRVKHYEAEIKQYKAQIAREDLTRDQAHRIYLQRYRSASAELRQILDNNWQRFTRTAFIERWKIVDADGETIFTEEFRVKSKNCQP